MVERSLIFLVLSVSHLLQRSVSNADSMAERCPINDRMNLTGGTVDESSGFMVKSGFVFPLKSTWVQNGEIFGCFCYNRPNCLTMYCPSNTTMYHTMDRDCAKTIYRSEDYDYIRTTPVVYSVDVPIRKVEVIDRRIYERYSDTDCERYWMDPIDELFQDDGIYSGRNGAVWIPQKNISAIYNFDAYCQCNRTFPYDFYFPCPYGGIFHTANQYPDKEHNNTTQGTTMVSQVGMIISIPFLLVTFIIYTVLPELKNIHGLTLRGYVGCLLVAYTTLAIIEIAPPISDVTCLVFAFTIYFSFVATFFWLNVMCFDIWWTLGDHRSLQRSVRKSNCKKFFTYSLYAWGFPILLTGVCMIVTFVPGVSDNLITPEFGIESICWFKTKTARAIYLYGPMAATIIANIFFFISTAVKIINQKKDTARHLEGVDSKRHDDNRQWFNLYLKLFIVMGINWSMEIPAWLFEDLEHIWYITDLGNALQGLFIFIIFICKKNVKLLLVKHFGFRIPNFLSWYSTRNVQQSSTSKSGATPIS